MQSKIRITAFIGRRCSFAFIPSVFLLALLLALIVRQQEDAALISVKVPSGLKPERNNWFEQNNSETKNCNVENYVFGQPVEQDDPCLIATFKKEMLFPVPSFEEQNHEEPDIAGEMASNIEKFNWIEKLLIENSSKTDGFFVECGANDGEFISPTIRLEKKYNWTGLLIEANPIPFKSLIEKKRNAWAVNAAACITTHPQLITFFTKPNETGVSGINKNPKKGVTVNVTVQCIPMYTMIKAVGITKIDYFSLDVEGLELEILKTIPWDKIDVKVMTVEYAHVPGKQQVLKEFLEPRGYRFVKEILDSLTLDCLFVHESLYEKAKQIKQ